MNAVSPVETLVTDHLDLWTTALKRKSTAGRGSSSKVELYGIKKLRELILELAVRGLLVPQDPNDEPASELLKRIAAERAKLLKEGRIKKGKPLPSIAGGSKQLPPGWSWTCMAALGEISPRNEAKDDVIASFVPMPLISTRFDGRHDHESTTWAEIKKGYTHFADGDVAIAKITPCFENSKAAIFSGLHNGIGAGTTELHVVRPIGEFVSRSYLLLYLKSPPFLRVGETKMTGSAGQKRVPTEFFSFNPLPLPPLAEQHRIVAKVDELMALCDQLEQQTDATLGAHQTLVETLLSALTSTADHAQFASAWQRIAGHFDTLFTTEESIAQLKQTLLHLAVMGKLNGDISDSWKTQRLDEVCSEIVDCPHSTPKWTATGKICVRTSQFRPGKLDLSECRFVSASTFAERVARLKPEADDILYSREGGILGVACRVPPKVELCLGQRMMLMRPGNRILPSFLEIALNSPVITEIARQQTTGGAAPRVNVSTVKSYPVPVPSLAEQHRIVAKVDELMALCDQLKSCLNAAQTTQLHLADALVEQAIC